MLPAIPALDGHEHAHALPLTHTSVERELDQVYRPASNYRLVLSERNNAKAWFTLTLVKRKIDGGPGGLVKVDDKLFSLFNANLAVRSNA